MNAATEMLDQCRQSLDKMAREWPLERVIAGVVDEYNNRVEGEGK